MYAVIELVEGKELVQIAVNQNYFNRYADKLCNAVRSGATDDKQCRQQCRHHAYLYCSSFHNRH